MVLHNHWLSLIGTHDAYCPVPVRCKRLSKKNSCGLRAPLMQLLLSRLILIQESRGVLHLPSRGTLQIQHLTVEVCIPCSPPLLSHCASPPVTHDHICACARSLFFFPFFLFWKTHLILSSLSLIIIHYFPRSVSHMPALLHSLLVTHLSPPPPPSWPMFHSISHFAPFLPTFFFKHPGLLSPFALFWSDIVVWSSLISSAILNQYTDGQVH